MESFLQNLVKSLGLSPNEEAVFLLLLNVSSLRANEIAKLTKLNRSTTYGILKSLSEQGLVTSFERNGTVLEYQSIDPHQLVDYLERKRSDLARTSEELREHIPQLTDKRSSHGSYPKIQFFQGVEGVKQAYEDSLTNNTGKIIYDISGTDAVYERMGEDWVHYYISKRAALGIECRVIAPDTEWSHKSKKIDKVFKRVTKLIPADFGFDTEVDIWDNKVGLFTFTEDNPIAVLIEDERVANTMRQMFRYIYSALEE
jgi:sugar-specific transcriptional regulator TrmB